MTNYMQ